MFCKHLTILFVFGFALCSPHTHKNKDGSKETVEHGNYAPLDSNHYKNGEHDNEFDHESILGSHSAVEEFDHLPPEEAKKRLFSLALQMDADGDKYVDRKELVNWVLRSFKLLIEERAMDDIESEDVDGDGKVTWEEHVAEAFGLYDDDISMSPEEQKEELEMLENDRELFNAADVNGDGMLDLSEYPAYSFPAEFDHMREVLHEQIMREQDTDKDGFLTFEEFTHNPAAESRRGKTDNPSASFYGVAKDLFTSKFDLNSDHKLSKEELLPWLIPNKVKTAESEADHLIERSDSDNDGKLSMQEIVDHHDIFVGSEATGFSDQLENERFVDEL